MTEITLRPYQKKLIQDVKNSWKKGNKHVIMQAATGSGKTVCFSYMAQKSALKGNKILILTHRQELMNQTSGSLANFHLNPKLIDAKTREIPISNCYVCMTNSLRNRLKQDRWKKWLENISLVIIDECFTGDTELLTEKGFVPFSELGRDYKVAQFFNGNISFDNPKRYIKKYHDGEMSLFHAKNNIDIPMTCGHDQLLYSKTRGYYKEKISEIKFNYTKRLPLCGESIEKSEELSIIERLYIATQADGSIHRKVKGNTIISFSFSKERKVERLIDLCDAGNIRIHEVKARNKMRRFLVWMPIYTTKDIRNHIKYPMSSRKAKEVISECVKWDGSIISKTMDYYCSTNKSQVDFYNSVAVIAGYSCNIMIEKDGREDRYRNMYRLFINKNLKTKDTTSMSTSKITYKGLVYCVEMESGAIIVRHNGFTFVSGNCHQQDFNWIFETPGIKEKYIIGATATPKRTNSQVELAHQYSDIVAGPDVQEMINIGYLCPDRYYSVPVDMSGVKTKVGDYDTEQMYGRYNKSELYSGVIDNWKRICPDTITLCFCVNIQHCVNTCRAFNEAGIKAKFIVSDLSNPKQRSENKADISLFKLKKEEYQNYLINFERYSGERKKIINQWEQGEFKVLINAGIATTGFDFPPIQTIIMDRSTTSDNLLLQILGRGSRISDGKEYFNILDFGDNCSRLGYYRQQREYSLFHETKNSGGGVPPVKECTQCHALVFASSRVCKYCGYVFPLTHDEKIVELKEVKYSEATTHLTSIHDYEVFAETKGYKKSWMFRQVYIKFGIEGLKEYAKSHHISPTWVYVQKARYDAQGIRSK